MLIEPLPVLLRRPRTKRRLLLSSGVWSVLLGGGLLGCSGDTTGYATNPHPLPPTQVFWALQLNQHAINMALVAPSDTIRLTATPLNAEGTPLANVGRVTYSASDSNVTVDATGLVKANYPTPQTHVTASLTVGGVTLTDSALIQVTPTAFPAPLATFSIQPTPGGIGSNYRISVSIGNLFTDNQLTYCGKHCLPVSATIATGNPATDTICNINACPLLVYYSSSNVQAGAIDPYAGTGLNAVFVADTLTFFADTWAYGVFKRDSIPYSITYYQDNFLYLNLQPTIAKTGDSKPVIYPTNDTIGLGQQVYMTTLTMPAYLLDKHGNIQVTLDDTVGVSMQIDSSDNNGSYTTHITPINFCFTTACNKDSATHVIDVLLSFGQAGVYHLNTLPIPGPSTTIVVSVGPCLHGKEPTCQ